MSQQCWSLNYGWNHPVEFWSAKVKLRCNSGGLTTGNMNKTLPGNKITVLLAFLSRILKENLTTWMQCSNFEVTPTWRKKRLIISKVCKWVNTFKTILHLKIMILWVPRIKNKIFNIMQYFLQDILFFLTHHVPVN